MAMREAVVYEIFLDLHKAYDALDWDRCREILVAYGVGPRALQILRMYWGHIAMVAKSRGYYAPPFKGYHGLTQGYPIKYGCGRHHTPLGDGGSGNRGGFLGTWSINTGP